jgi:hypothetical protein
MTQQPAAQKSAIQPTRAEDFPGPGRSQDEEFEGELRHLAGAAVA